MIESVHCGNPYITNTEKQQMKHMIAKTRTLSEEALEQILTEARTHSAWLPEPVSDELLIEIYDLMKWGPTSANSSPARIVFVRSKEAKEKLLPCMAEGNVEKTKAAPVTSNEMWVKCGLPAQSPKAQTPDVVVCRRSL